MSQRPLTYIELEADDLVYATCARTVEQTLECGEGIDFGAERNGIDASYKI